MSTLTTNASARLYHHRSALGRCRGALPRVPRCVCPWASAGRLTTTYFLFMVMLLLTMRSAAEVRLVETRDGALVLDVQPTAWGIWSTRVGAETGAINLAGDLTGDGFPSYVATDARLLACWHRSTEQALVILRLQRRGAMTIDAVPLRWPGFGVPFVQPVGPNWLIATTVGGPSPSVVAVVATQRDTGQPMTLMPGVLVDVVATRETAHALSYDFFTRQMFVVTIRGLWEPIPVPIPEGVFNPEPIPVPLSHDAVSLHGQDVIATPVLADHTARGMDCSLLSPTALHVQVGASEQGIVQPGRGAAGAWPATWAPCVERHGDSYVLAWKTGDGMIGTVTLDEFGVSEPEFIPGPNGSCQAVLNAAMRD